MVFLLVFSWIVDIDQTSLYVFEQGADLVGQFTAPPVLVWDWCVVGKYDSCKKEIEMCPSVMVGL